MILDEMFPGSPDDDAVKQGVAEGLAEMSASGKKAARDDHRSGKTQKNPWHPKYHKDSKTQWDSDYAKEMDRLKKKDVAEGEWKSRHTYKKEQDAAYDEYRRNHATSRMTLMTRAEFAKDQRERRAKEKAKAKSGVVESTTLELHNPHNPRDWGQIQARENRYVLDMVINGSATRQVFESQSRAQEHATKLGLMVDDNNPRRTDEGKAWWSGATTPAGHKIVAKQNEKIQGKKFVYQGYVIEFTPTEYTISKALKTVYKKSGDYSQPTRLNLAAARRVVDMLVRKYTSGNVEEDLRDPQDNPCWKGYYPVGTKKKAGRTVPNCVPNASQIKEQRSGQNDPWKIEYSVYYGFGQPERIPGTRIVTMSKTMENKLAQIAAQHGFEEMGSGGGLEERDVSYGRSGENLAELLQAGRAAEQEILKMARQMQQTNAVLGTAGMYVDIDSRIVWDQSNPNDEKDYGWEDAEQMLRSGGGHVQENRKITKRMPRT